MLRRVFTIANLLLRCKVHNAVVSRFSIFTILPVPPRVVNEEKWKVMQIRSFAKGKDKKKEKAKSKKVAINENEINEVVDYEKLKQEMTDAINNLRHDFVHKISLRSTTGGIDTLRFSYKGEKIDILEVAKINRSNPDLVIIDMSSTSHLLPTVLKVIASSGMNLNPQQDGSSIVIPIPQVTQQFKEGLSKNAKSMFIKCRDLIKDCQNKYLKLLKSKAKEGVSEDVISRVSEQIIYMGNSYIADAEKLLQKKQDELTS